MHSHRWTILLLAAFFPSLSPALPTRERVAADPPAMELLGRNSIVVTTTGHVAVAYRDLARAFRTSDLLGDIQREYARQLTNGQPPGFAIEQRGPGDYHYVNRGGHETSIREIHLGEHEGPTIEVVLLASGRRFFGRFQTLIHVTVTPEADNHLRYEATVYAYPEVGLARFVARHLGLVERYFRDKTTVIEAICTRIGAGLCAPKLALVDGAPR